MTEQLPKELAAIYWPKNMYWRAGKPERFVRPVKWLLALLDHAIVPVEFAGVHAANLTYGHRILHGDCADGRTCRRLSGVLEAAQVTADVELRRHRIRKGLDAATRIGSGGELARRRGAGGYGDAPDGVAVGAAGKNSSWDI